MKIPEFCDFCRSLVGRLGGSFFLQAGDLEVLDLTGLPEGLHLFRQGAIPFVPRTYPFLRDSGLLPGVASSKYRAETSLELRATGGVDLL